MFDLEVAVTRAYVGETSIAEDTHTHSHTLTQGGAPSVCAIWQFDVPLLTLDGVAGKGPPRPPGKTLLTSKCDPSPEMSVLVRAARVTGENGKLQPQS